MLTITRKTTGERGRCQWHVPFSNNVKTLKSMIKKKKKKGVVGFKLLKSMIKNLE